MTDARVRTTVLAVTDRVGEGLTNGSQVFSDALLTQLAQWFDLTIVTARAVRPSPFLANRLVMVDESDVPVRPEGEASNPPDPLGGQVDLDSIALIYNLGATAFSSRIAEILTRIIPDIPLVNHFQVLLEVYAHHEGWDDRGAEELGRNQNILAARAERNLFSSFAELRAASARWADRTRKNFVVPNAFVGADVGLPGPKYHPSTFLAAGRFTDKAKGADLLYRAFAQLLERHPEARLSIASDGQRHLEILRTLPADSWTFLGWLERPALLEAMRSAAAVVVPSRYEPFGMVAVEAMAMGTPVIAMAVGGLAETVCHGLTGWLTPPKEGSLGLRLAMESALRDPAHTKAMGLHAQEVAEREYSLGRVSNLVRAHLNNARALNGAGVINLALNV